MEPVLDVDKYEELQEKFVREIIEQIRLKLVKAGITGSSLKDLTLEIAFSVASTIDDNAAIEAEGIEVHPYLTFLVNENQIIHCGENSFTHEFVTTQLDQVFSE